MNSLKDLQKRALDVQSRYKLLNKSNNFDEWGAKEYAMGLVGDTGDLLKLVMAKENLRQIDNASEKIKHELSDCLWSLLVIASIYEIDLEDSFLKTMDQLDARIEKGSA